MRPSFEEAGALQNLLMAYYDGYWTGDAQRRIEALIVKGWVERVDRPDRNPKVKFLQTTDAGRRALFGTRGVTRWIQHYFCDETDGLFRAVRRSGRQWKIFASRTPGGTSDWQCNGCGRSKSFVTWRQCSKDATSHALTCRGSKGMPA